MTRRISAMRNRVWAKMGNDGAAPSRKHGTTKNDGAEFTPPDRPCTALRADLGIQKPPCSARKARGRLHDLCLAASIAMLMLAQTPRLRLRIARRWTSCPNDVCMSEALSLGVLWPSGSWMVQANCCPNQVFARGTLILVSVLGGYWVSVLGILGQFLVGDIFGDKTWTRNTHTSFRLLCMLCVSPIRARAFQGLRQ